METEDGHLDPITDIRNAVSSIQQLQEMVLPLLQELSEKFQSIDEKVKVVIEVLQYLEAENEHEVNEELVMHTGIQIDLKEETLSDVAKLVLSNSEGPLDSENFQKFLMEKAWGKPKPPILPIIRKYTNDMQGLLEQLRRVKNKINHNHLLYKDQRRLDVNLNLRIDRLVVNIDKELATETKLNQRQTSITDFTR